MTERALEHQAGRTRRRTPSQRGTGGGVAALSPVGGAGGPRRAWRRGVAVCGVVVGVTGCLGADRGPRQGPSNPGVQGVAAAAGVAVTRAAMARSLPPGLSGLGVDGDGRLLAVPERARSLVVFSQADGVYGGSFETVPLVGAPAGFDLESVAVVGPGRLAFGTETPSGDRAEERILWATWADGAVTFTGETLALSYAGTGIRGSSNRGIEALCACGGALVGVAEDVMVQEDGSRAAPVWVHDLATGATTQGRVPLVSETGKVSGASCTRDAAGVQLSFIERHFGVVRLGRVRLSGAAEGGASSWDLAPAIGEDPPNLEGLVTLPDGRIFAISDNDYGGVNGPAELVQITLP